MIKKSDYKVESASGEMLDVRLYEPDSAENCKRAMVQILHGMQEHKERYDDFASFLAHNGYHVLIHDHLGHGHSVGAAHPLGDMVAFAHVLKDIDLVRESVDFDGMYICFGHSMGSFLARIYAARYDVDALIACGSGNPSSLEARFMKLLLRLQKPGVPLPRMQSVINKSMSRGFRSPGDWLSYNKDNQARYMADPLCGVPFTREGYVVLSDIVIRLAARENYDNCTAQAILLISGKDDPVGRREKDVKEILKQYIRCGKNASAKLYENMTHEILNETDSEKVYKDVLEWLESLR